MLLAWLQGMLGHEFMRSALLASTGVGIGAGATGYFLVLRGQVFAADALSHVAFTGALAALALGLPEPAGLILATVLVGALLSSLSSVTRAGDVAIGAVFAWILGLGVLFLSIYVTTRSTSNGTGAVGVLFGTVFGIAPGSAAVSAGMGITAALLVALAARPLLFASVDAAAAAAQGVPVRLLGLGFMILVGLMVAEAVQVIGALLILGLLATPAAIARTLTARPLLGMGLSSATALAAVWLGLALSYSFPVLPPSFAIMALLFATYVAVTIGPRLRRAALLAQPS